VYRNIEARSCIRCCSEKTVIITSSDYSFVALVIQHAMCMCHIILSSLFIRVYYMFPLYLMSGKILRKTFLDIKFVF